MIDSHRRVVALDTRRPTDMEPKHRSCLQKSGSRAPERSRTDISAVALRSTCTGVKEPRTEMCPVRPKLIVMNALANDFGFYEPSWCVTIETHVEWHKLPGPSFALGSASLKARPADDPRLWQAPSKSKGRPNRLVAATILESDGNDRALICIHREVIEAGFGGSGDDGSVSAPLILVRRNGDRWSKAEVHDLPSTDICLWQVGYSPRFHRLQPARIRIHDRRTRAE